MRATRHHRVHAALVAAPMLALTAAWVPPASAVEPSLVNVLGCQLLEGGETTIPEGSHLTLRLPGFAQGNRGLLTTAVNAATASMTLARGDGTEQVVDVTDTLGVTNDGPLFWVARPANYPVGPLEAGDVLTVTYQLTFSHPVAVLYPPVGPTGANGPYVIDAEDPASCTITVDGT